MTEALTRRESRELTLLEATITTNLRSFVEVGLALATIREQKLYRAEYTSFDVYCHIKWGMGKSYAGHLIRSANVMGRLEAATIVPTAESQVRELGRLPEEKQAEAWTEAVGAAGGVVPTAEVVAKVVDTLGGKKKSARAALHSSRSVEWFTPVEIIEAARSVMRGFELDPASCAEANKVVKATEWYGVESDPASLDRKWRGRVWLNCPFGTDERGTSNQARWSSKLIKDFKAGYCTEGCLLVNASTGSNWFKPLWQFPICFVSYRLKFRAPGGEIQNQPTHSNVIVYVGPNVIGFVEAFRDFGPVAVPVDGGWVSHSN